MAFLRLDNIICLMPIGGAEPPLNAGPLNDIQSGLNVATAAQIAVLQQIPCN
jgi:hypothetical protein